MFVWSTDRDELYEQRRIRHLVEQARIKGGKKLDWVYEAQVRARGIDWGTGKLKNTDEVHNGVLATGDKNTTSARDSKENIESFELCVAEQQQSKLFSSHQINRSKSFIAP